MIEKEQNYIDLLRSQIASSPDEKKLLELAKTEKNLQTLQAMLMRSQNEVSPLTLLCFLSKYIYSKISVLNHGFCFVFHSYLKI